MIIKSNFCKKQLAVLAASVMVISTGAVYTQQAQAMDGRMTQVGGDALTHIMSNMLGTIARNIETREAEEAESFQAYDVPMDCRLQSEIKAICDEYGVEMPLILAMIQYESGFDAEVVGDGEESYGLMQIQPKWHEERMSRLGVTDLMSPSQNVRVGIDLLSELLAKGKGTEWALMAYNGGEAFADRKTEEGTVSEYVEKVLEYRDAIASGAGNIWEGRTIK